mgnify:CR=1 FL=1
MADRFAILGQAFPTVAWSSDSDEVELYSVPLVAEGTVGSEPKSLAFQTQTIVSSIIVCSQATVNPVGFYVRLRKYDFSAGALEPLVPPISNKQFLFHNTDVGPNKTQILSVALTLSPGDKISVGTETGSKLSFTAMGIEVT